MKRWLIVFLLLFGSGCGSEPWSPLGTYEMILIWRGGTCNLQQPRIVNITVLSNGDDEFFLDADPGAETMGEIFPGNGDCLLSFAVAEPDGIGLGFLGTAVTTYNITERDGDLEGAGMISVSSPDNCQQVFSVEGSKSDPSE